MPDRIYVTLAELIEETGAHGFKDEAAAVRYLRRASDYLDRELKYPITPVTETKTFDGSGEIHQIIYPCLSITTLAQDGTSITNTQYNKTAWWENGPFTRLTVAPDATELGYWTCERAVLSITGQWGLYNESVDTGATVQNTTQISASGTALLCANGALLSPGMNLLVESEQMLITATGAATDSTANTAEALDTTEEGVDVNDGTQVNVGEVIKIDNEQMKVLDIVSNTLTVTRGWNGTTKATHTTSTDVYVYRTFTVKRGVNGTTAAAHLNGVAISRYLPPYEVNYAVLETAVMRAEKAKSKFSGRQGSIELGETFYYGDFPKELVKSLKNQFRIPGL